MAELELFGKVLLAAVLGFLIGLEREWMGSPAGDRTFSLVAVGAAIFTVLSFDVFSAGDGVSDRIAANIVTGVGFLGGGMILKEGGTVRGLTTAAGIWATAAMSMAIGTDRYLLGFLTAALIMLVFAAERRISVKRMRSGTADRDDENERAREETVRARRDEPSLLDPRPRAPRCAWRHTLRSDGARFQHPKRALLSRP